MGIIAASIIILALIFYAIKDLLSDRDFSAWTNMAITSLILFTVILSIFMVLNKKDDSAAAAKKDKPAATEEAKPEEAQSPQEEMTDEQAMMAIAQEYISIEDDCNKNAPKDTVCADVAANYIIGKYEFTDTEWQAFLQTAAKDNLFEKARKGEALSSSPSADGQDKEAAADDAQEETSAAPVQNIAPAKKAEVTADQTQHL